MLYMIGIGLHDPKDITFKGLEAIKKASRVYLEYYTSKYADIDELRSFTGKDIILADRDMVESGTESILKDADKIDIAFLVIGDPFAATTHIGLKLEAEEKGIPVNVIHNASVLTAIGITGLELYKFGKVTSIPFGYEEVTAPLEVCRKNQQLGLHTLFLLDLDPMNDRFMTINEACGYLEPIEPSVAIGCAGLGADNPEIVSGTLKELQAHKFFLFPQCLIIPGNLHFMEEDALNRN
ncbi:MAG: diphthine synthase [Candidatus Woesearchaeota archaeon]